MNLPVNVIILMLNMMSQGTNSQGYYKKLQLVLKYSRKMLHHAVTTLSNTLSNLRVVQRGGSPPRNDRSNRFGHVHREMNIFRNFHVKKCNCSEHISSISGRQCYFILINLNELKLG